MINKLMCKLGFHKVQKGPITLVYKNGRKSHYHQIEKCSNCGAKRIYDYFCLELINAENTLDSFEDIRIFLTDWEGTVSRYD